MTKRVSLVKIREDVKLKQEIKQGEKTVKSEQTMNREKICKALSYLSER